MVLKKAFFLLCIPFSFIYYLIIFFRNLFYTSGVFRSCRIGAKVISVGNITWGGTGKTPVVAFIADMLSKKNRKASILIRGYGNDESELLPKLTLNVPVLVGRDRVKTGRLAIEERFSDTIILDDGFQYRRLKRDLDIVCIDAVNPFGNRWLIPAGSLREGLGSLKRADIFLLTKTDLASDKDRLEKLQNKLRSVNPKAIIAKAIHRPLYFYRLINEEKVTIGELKNKELVLVSAIGSPECFEKTIQRLGLKIKRHFIFRDHYLYTKDDMGRINDYCRKNSLTTVIITEKDAVKLKSLQPSAFSLQLLVLKVRLEIIENEDGFSDRLFGVYSS